MSSRRPSLRFVAALATVAFAAALPAHAGDPVPASPVGLDQAHEEYVAGRYRPAFEAYARLADGGDVEAARIATLMVRFGPRLYEEGIWASPERLQHWRRLLESAAKPRTAAPD